MSLLNWISAGGDASAKLQVTSVVSSISLFNKGRSALLTTQKGCYIAHLSDTWEYQNIFHESSIPPRFARVIPCEESFQILCVYSTFSTRFQIEDSESLFSTRLLNSYHGGKSLILSVDVLDSCFVTADESGQVIIRPYDNRKPIGTIEYSSLEALSGMRSINPLSRKVLKVAFDTTFNQNNVGFISEDICCVYSLHDLSKPINYLTIRDCSPAKRSRLRHLRSFAFCGNGNLLVLTDNEIYRWNYVSGTLSDCLKTSEDHSSFRSIRWNGEHSIIEVLSTNELSLCAMIKQEGVLPQRQSQTDNLVTLRTRKVTGVRVFDSFLDYEKKHYDIYLSQEKQSVLRYIIQGDASDSKQRKGRKGNQKNIKNDHLISNLLNRQDISGSEVISDLYEITDALMSEENNRGFKLVQVDVRNGLLVIRYEILNSHVRITMSFKKSLSIGSPSFLINNLPYNHSRNQLDCRSCSAISYDNLTIDAEFEDGSPRVEGLMDYIRLELHSVAADVKSGSASNESRFLAKQQNRIRTVLEKTLKIFDDIRKGLPEEKHEKQSEIVEQTVENDDSLIDCPPLFFTMVFNDVVIYVSNSCTLFGGDRAVRRVVSYQDYKSRMKWNENREAAFDGDSETELYHDTESETDEMELSSQSTAVCPHCFSNHDDDSSCLYQQINKISIDFHYSDFISSLASSLKLPPLPPSSSPVDLQQYIEYNLGVLEQLSNGDFQQLSRRQLVIWKLFSNVFSREVQSSSIGSLFFIRHMLSRIWNVTREQGDLLLFAILIAFCRVYSRIHHVDVLQYVEHTQGVDLDNVLLNVAEIFDRKEMFGTKMELRKYILNSDKLSICRVLPDMSPTSSMVEEGNSVRKTRNKASDDGTSPSYYGKRYGSEKSTITDSPSHDLTSTVGRSDAYPLCAVCHNPIYGLFALCQFCKHSFHVQHYESWFEKHDCCPVTGCDHFCNHILSTDRV